MIEGLNLQAAGIGVDAHGAIVVNDQLRTTVPHVWAMGDVKGGPQFTYLSLDDFRSSATSFSETRNGTSEIVTLFLMPYLSTRRWLISDLPKKKH